MPTLLLRVQAKKRHVSYAVLAEVCIVKGRSFRQNQPGGLDWQRPGRFFPQVAVAQYLLNNGRVFDESNNLHCSPASGAFKLVNLGNSLYERDTGHSAF